MGKKKVTFYLTTPVSVSNFLPVVCAHMFIKPIPFFILMLVISGRKKGLHQKAIALYWRRYPRREWSRLFEGPEDTTTLTFDVWGLLFSQELPGIVCTEGSSFSVAKLTHLKCSRSLTESWGEWKENKDRVVVTRPAALKVSSVPRIPKTLLSSPGDQNRFPNSRHHFLFSVSFCHECTLEFSRGYTMRDFATDQMRKQIWESGCFLWS